MTDNSEPESDGYGNEKVVGAFIDLMDRRIGGRFVELATQIETAARTNTGDLTAVDIAAILRQEGERLLDTYTHGREEPE